MNTARDLLATLADAYNRHDLDGIRALYAPDARVNDTTVDAALATHGRCSHSCRTSRPSCAPRPPKTRSSSPN